MKLLSNPITVCSIFALVLNIGFFSNANARATGTATTIAVSGRQSTPVPSTTGRALPDDVQWADQSIRRQVFAAARVQLEAVLGAAKELEGTDENDHPLRRQVVGYAQYDRYALAVLSEVFQDSSGAWGPAESNVAVSVDLRTNKVTPVEGRWYLWSFIRTAQFQTGLPADIVFAGQNCTECEAVKSISSFMFDRNQDAWALRTWGDRGVTSAAIESQGVEPPWEQHDGYDIADYNGDGLDDLATRVRQRNTDTGFVLQASSLYTTISGDSQIVDITAAKALADFDRRFCSIPRNSTLCKPLPLWETTGADAPRFKSRSQPELKTRLPNEAKSCLSAPQMATLAVNGELKKFFVRANLTGSSSPDIAILVRDRTTGKRGVAICSPKISGAQVLAAGRGYQGVDTLFVNDMTTYPRSRYFGDDPRGKQPGDVLRLETQIGNLFVYWNGKEIETLR